MAIVSPQIPCFRFALVWLKRSIAWGAGLSFNRQIFVGLCYLLLSAGGAIAQPADTSMSASGAAAVSPEQPPPGGCMPIGITAAGDVVFPFACKDLIDLHRGKGPQTPLQPDVSQAPAPRDGADPTADTIKATGSVAIGQQSRGAELEGINGADGASAQPVPPDNEKPELNRGKRKTSRASRGDPVGCTSFRTYDPKTESYRDFNGRRRPCRT